VEKRDADNLAYAMALGARLGPLAEVVGVRVLAAYGRHADFKCLLEPMPQLAPHRAVWRPTSGAQVWIEQCGADLQAAIR